MLHMLNTLAAAQKSGAHTTVKALTYFLNYSATLPGAKRHYSANTVVLHIHSDAPSYLTKPDASNQAGGHHFLSDHPATSNAATIALILNVAKILCNAMSSTAKAKVGALFSNAKEATILHTTLKEMGHPQPATPL
jgi:hypothetical protein